MGSNVRSKKAKESAVETPAQILAAAKKATYDMLAFARGAKTSAAAIRSERFEWNRSQSTIDDSPIHYFRTRGETLTGTLGPAEFESWKGTTHKLVLDDGSFVRLPGNRQLTKLIARTKCVYLRITIEYLGKRWLTSRHYEKVYAIHPAPLSAESIADTKEGRAVLAQVGASTKANKGGRTK